MEIAANGLLVGGAPNYTGPDARRYYIGSGKRVHLYLAAHPDARVQMVIYGWYESEQAMLVNEKRLIRLAKSIYGRRCLNINTKWQGDGFDSARAREATAATHALKDKKGRSINARKAALALTSEKRSCIGRKAGAAVSASRRVHRKANPRPFKPARPGSRKAVVAALLHERYPLAITLAEFTERTDAERETQVRNALDHLLSNGYHTHLVAPSTWALLPSCPSLRVTR